MKECIKIHLLFLAHEWSLASAGLLGLGPEVWPPPREEGCPPNWRDQRRPQDAQGCELPWLPTQCIVTFGSTVSTKWSKYMKKSSV